MRRCSILACLFMGSYTVHANDFFETKIRPVLVEHCYKCHSAQPGKEPKGGLRVDSRAALLLGGDNGPAIVPGDPNKGKFIEALRYTNTDLQMPPKGKLSEQVVADFVTWVKNGADWPNDTGTATASSGIDVAKRKREHWAWKPLTQPARPNVTDAQWALQPSDAFILAKLEAKGLKPAPSASAHTLIRRVYYDLVGLPPTPATVEAFVKASQESPQQALANLVDELLQSPHFGERWARHWLDLVRYGETRGHEFDPIIPNAYQYRDYVIRALNADVPYNQFVQEHIAGDQMPKPRLHPKEGFNESILGTGFYFLGEEVHSPVDIRQDQADRFDNRIDVLTKTFMALTVSCARCHDHKFDAITTKDYYALFGILESANYRLARFDTREQHQQAAQQMATSDREFTKAVTKDVQDATQPFAKNFAAYLLASREAILTGPEYATTTGERGDVVFEDFESGTYAKWELTGTAFGDKPQTLQTIAPYQGKINGGGKYFVNSHNLRQGETVTRSDSYQGTMLSKAFTIKHDAITMLVGGGSHKEKTCVNLLVDGKILRTATGRDNNQMFPVRWDVRDLRGREARIQVVDAFAGGWGNISLDDIVFTNRGDKLGSTKVLAEQFSPTFQERVSKIAKQQKLDTTLLQTWVAVMLTAHTDTTHPLHAWAKLAHDPQAHDTKRFAQLWPTATKSDMKGIEVVLNFANNTTDAWRPDDVGFGTGPTRPGDVRVNHGEPRFTETAAAEFDRIWNAQKVAAETEEDTKSALGRKHRAGRTIRTPTFKVTNGHVYYLVRGSGTAYAAVSAHTLIAGPLHGRLVQDFPDVPGFRWVHHDLTPYQGQLTHIELTAGQNSDFAVAMVVQADRTPPLPIVRLGEGATTLGELAQAYQTALERVGQGAIATPHDATLANVWLRHPELHSKLVEQITKHVADRELARQRLVSTLKMESRVALAMQEGNGVDEHVFIRGSPKGLGDKVPRRFLEALTGTKPIAAVGSGRWELATLMTNPEVNPFSTRVFVNRVWHHLFGRGIVASVDNFGVLGETPTHPELLDDLAIRFAREGWSLKKLLRELLLSRAYQMASHVDPTVDANDPQNLLLHRMNLRRMEGEAIRDAMLQVSGRLDRTLHGPSVPIYLTPFLDGRGKPDSGPLDGRGRRSLYLATKRNFLSPFLQAFDTPIPFSTVGRRQISNVPAQALILLNDPFVHQQAGLWAKKVLQQPGNTAERISSLYQTAFIRPPTAEESTACIEFLNEQAKRYNSTANDLKPWTDLTHMLFNAKEFIYID